MDPQRIEKNSIPSIMRMICEVLSCSRSCTSQSSCDDHYDLIGKYLAVVPDPC